MMLRIAYRFVVPAVLLLATLAWFSDHLRLLPTRDKVAEYVKQFWFTEDGFSWASNGTQTAINSTQTTTTTTTDAVSDAPTSTASPLKDVIDAIITDSRDKIVVMGALNREDTTWVSHKLPDWQNAIYAVEDTNPNPFHAPNKGHEASPYLTYIINNYDTLPSTIAFIHAHEKGWPKAWHTDAGGYSNVASLQSLNVNFVQQAGYANLRCIAKPGCPDEMQPFRNPPNADGDAENAFAEAWKVVFNNTDVPKVVAVPCCAQFAVSRVQIRQRPREFYVGAMQWLLDTQLDDPTSGRVFEYMWHIIFGRDAVHCPEMAQCYKEVYNKEHLSFKSVEVG